MTETRGRMWQLKMTNAAKEWIEVGAFETVTAAARRITELEDNPVNGIFLEFYVDTTPLGTDEEAFRVLHYTGRRAHYGIRRSRPN
jgi:hypothetical protein